MRYKLCFYTSMCKDIIYISTKSLLKILKFLIQCWSPIFGQDFQTWASCRLPRACCCKVTDCHPPVVVDPIWMNSTKTPSWKRKHQMFSLAVGWNDYFSFNDLKSSNWKWLKKSPQVANTASSVHEATLNWYRLGKQAEAQKDSQRICWVWSISSENYSDLLISVISSPPPISASWMIFWAAVAMKDWRCLRRAEIFVNGQMLHTPLAVTGPKVGHGL